MNIDMNKADIYISTYNNNTFLKEQLKWLKTVLYKAIIINKHHQQT
jgi:hypothetical protein